MAFALSKHILASLRRLDDLAINDLRKINKELQDAYDDLKAAQVKLVEKKRLEHELKLAADVQKSLLPGYLPQYSDYSFVAHLEPARVVGGDFYDVIPLDDENVGLLIADVADKGIHAAMLMGVARALFFTEARRSLSPSVVAVSVHKNLISTGLISTTAFLKWQKEQLQLVALGKYSTWQMYRRKLKVLNRNKMIVFVDQHFGIFPSHEVFMLANVPVHDIAEELNITREQVYAKYKDQPLTENS